MNEQTLRRIYTARRNSHQYGAPVKRASDILFALLALILLAPVFALIAIAIKRDSPGPVFFRGARAGRGGRVFQILKFRTMYETRDSYLGPNVTAHDDPRITPIGRWLRNTKLNELPQFWNVLRGEMSVVGPRPEDPAIVQGWPPHVRDTILAVRPGITSPASVLYHNEEALLSSGDVLGQYVREVGPNKQRLDQLYVRYRSIYLDIDTLLWTAWIMVPRVRGQEPPERLLLVGPVTHFVRRYLNWFIIDAFVATVAVGLAGGVWRIYGPLNVGWPKSIAAALVIALMFSVTAAALGVNRIKWPKARPQDVSDLLLAWGLAAALVFGVNLLARVLPNGLVVMAALLAVCGFVTARYRMRLVAGLLDVLMRPHAMGPHAVGAHWVRTRRLRGRQAGACTDRERVLIVGAGQDGEHAAWMVRRRGSSQKYELAGFADDDLFSHGMRVYGANVLGAYGDVPALVARHGIDVVVLADDTMSGEQQRAILQFCQKTGTRCVKMSGTLDALGAMAPGVEVKGGDPSRDSASPADAPPPDAPSADGLPPLQVAPPAQPRAPEPVRAGRATLEVS